MAEEFEKYAVLRNMFRRKSSVEFSSDGFKQIVDENQMSNVLDEMGAHVDKTELRKTMSAVAPESAGKMTFDQYAKICDQFVKDPTATSGAMEFKGIMNDFDT